VLEQKGLVFSAEQRKEKKKLDDGVITARKGKGPNRKSKEGEELT